MTKRVAPKLITVTEKLSQNQKQNRWWSCVTFVVSTRFTATSPAQPSPGQPSPAQPSLAATVQQVWESAGGFYAFIQYFYVCCLLYSDPESK